MTVYFCKQCGNLVTTILTHDCSKSSECPSCAILREELERRQRVIYELREELAALAAKEG